MGGGGLDEIDLQRVDNINNEITLTNTATSIGTYWFSLLGTRSESKEKQTRFCEWENSSNANYLKRFVFNFQTERGASVLLLGDLLKIIP